MCFRMTVQQTLFARNIWRMILYMRPYVISLRFSTSTAAPKKYFSNRNNHLEAFFSQYEDVKLTPMHVKSAVLGQSFTNARLDVFQYITDRDNNVVDPKLVDLSERQNIQTTGFCANLMSIFKEGMEEVYEILPEIEQEIVVKPHGDPTRHFRLVQAVKSLESFINMKEYHENCLTSMVMKEPKELNDLEITVSLTNHLFSPLVSGDLGNQSYIISDDSKGITYCPCSKFCDADIEYDNTGFGSQYLWFGRPDIMLFPLGRGRMSIVRAKKDDNSEVEDIDNESDLQYNYTHIRDMKKDAKLLRGEKNVERIVAETLTFSYYQNKYQRETSINPIVTVIPVICCTSHYFDIYMYDVQHDVLLRNVGDDPIPLFEMSENGNFVSRFRLDSILQIWMLINHLTLQPKLTSNQVSVFEKSCGIQYEIDKNNVTEKIMKTMKLSSCFSEMPKLYPYKMENVK